MSTRVNLLSHITEFAGEHQFNLRVNILDIVLDNEVATLAHGIDVTQFGKKSGKLLFSQQVYRLQHSDMSHTAQHIVLGKIEVHIAVASHGEPLYFLVYLKVLFPEFHCELRILNYDG